MANAPCSPKPNSQSEKQVSEKLNESNYFLKDSDVRCPEGTSSMKNTLAEEPSVNISADLPGGEALPSKRRKRAKRSSVPIIDDSDPHCLKGGLAWENISSEKNSCVQSLGRDVHHDSPHGKDTLLEEPSLNTISDLVLAEIPPHVDLSRRKRKKKKAVIGAAPESENSCLESCAGICPALNSEKAKQHSDLLPLQRQTEKKQNESCKFHESNDSRTNVELSYSQDEKNKMCKAHESSYESCDLSVGISVVENIMPTVDQSLQHPVAGFSEQELEVAVAQPQGISTKPNSECSEPIADSSCSRKKKKKLKKRCKIHESKGENDRRCDLSVGTSLVENRAPGIDPSQQPTVSKLSEQKLELPQPRMEGIITKPNSETSESIADLSCPRKKKNKLKNGRKNIMPGIDTSQQPPVSELPEQKLELPQPLMEGISMTASSEGPKPNTDLSCSQEKKKKKGKRKHETHESNVERCDLFVGTSSGGNSMPGVDLSLQPPVAIFPEQELEMEQPLVEGIRQGTNSEGPKPNTDLSCSQEKKKKKGKKKPKTHESNDERCDLSVGTSSGGNIMPGVDLSVQPPVATFQEQELEVEQPLVEGINQRTNSEGPKPNMDLGCSQKTKKKRRKIQGVDLSVQPPVAIFPEQELEVEQPLVEGISLGTNSEGPKPNTDLSCSREKKKKKGKKKPKTLESNDERYDLSVGTSSGGNIMPGVDLSVQPPVAIFPEQELEVEQPLVEGISQRTNSEGPKPNTDLGCSQKTKKKRRKIQGVDLSVQPPVAVFPAQELEVEQPLVEGISQRTNSEGPKPNTDLSCSQKTKKKRRKIHESNDKSCDPSVGTSLVENIIPGPDPSRQPPLAILSEQELKVPQLLLEESTFQENEDKKRNKRSNASGSNDNHDVRAGLPGQIVIDVKGYENNNDSSLSDVSKLKYTDIKESSCILEEQNGLQNSADGGSGNEIDTEVDCVSREGGNMKTYRRNKKVGNYHGKMDESCSPVNDLKSLEENGIKSTSSHCSDASPEAEDITDTKTEIKVPSLSTLAVKADVDVAVVVKEGNLAQIPDSRVERSLVSRSKKKLLILDVNGLLADIVQQESHISDRYKPDITISRKAVFKRPFCDDFLQFCFDRFNVGVWSSRTKKNVNMVMDFLLGDSRHKLLFCWDQSHCTTTKFNTIGNWHKPLVLKELRKLWEKHDPDLPWVRGEYNESNTLLLDDSPYKALRNPVNTAIFPYSYQYKDRRDGSLGPEGDIRCYLEGLAKADDVQNYVEQHPFGQRPITSKSRYWSFYRQVVEDGVDSPKH